MGMMSRGKTRCGRLPVCFVSARVDPCGCRQSLSAAGYLLCEIKR